MKYIINVPNDDKSKIILESILPLERDVIIGRYHSSFIKKIEFVNPDMEERICKSGNGR